MIREIDEQWPRVRAIAEEALELATHDRAAFVRRRCGGDTSLEDSVVALLQCDSADDDFLEPPRPTDKPDRYPSQATMIGHTVGRYRLVRPLGAGGMGMVYRAERIDGLHDRPVAVKLMRGDIDSPQARERFRNERLSLARLDHGAITRLLDGGTTVDDTPYVVMEYVEGVAIDEYCRDGRLSLDRRLALFLTVCEAVHFAHRNLIVHRDLKPGHILVTSKGEPKLLDFGLCKILQDDHGGRAKQDVTAAPILTLRYSSPEQIRCEPVTTATDVYALGCILYELLTEVRPFTSAERSSYELVQAICNVDPPCPSAVQRQRARLASYRRCDDAAASMANGRHADTAPPAHHVDHDLDSIVLKALHKNPAKRYGSVEQLADDIQRYRTGHPVRARDATFAYRATKFLRRNRAVAGVALVLLLAIGAGLAGTIIGLRSARQAQRHAEAEAARAVAIGSFLEQTLASVEPNQAPGGELTAVDLLDGAAARLNEWHAGAMVTASLRLTLGRAYRRFGRYEPALQNLALAVELGRTLADRDMLAEGQRELGLVHYARGDYDEAEKVLREALSIRREDGGDNDSATALAKSTLAGVLLAKAETAEAEALLTDAIPVLRAAELTDDEALGDALNTLGAVHRAHGALSKALECFSEALAVEQRVKGKSHSDVAITLSNLGNLYRTRGDFEEAEKLLQRAVDIFRGVLHPEHPDLATALNNLALVWMHMGKHEQAEPLVREALAIERKVRGPKHSHVAIAMSNLASLLFETGKYEEAEKMFEQSLALQREIFPEDHPALARTLAQYERLKAIRGRAGSAPENP